MLAGFNTKKTTPAFLTINRPAENTNIIANESEIAAFHYFIAEGKNDKTPWDIVLEACIIASPGKALRLKKYSNCLKL